MDTYKELHYTIENEEGREERASLMFKMVRIVHNLSMETSVQLDRKFTFRQVEDQLTAEIFSRAEAGASCLCSNSF